MMSDESSLNTVPLERFPPPAYPPTPKFSVRSFRMDESEMEAQADEIASKGVVRDRSVRGSVDSVVSNRLQELVSQLPSRRAEAYAFTESALHNNHRTQLTASLIENFIRETESGDLASRGSQHSMHASRHGASRHASRHASRANFNTGRRSMRYRTSVVSGPEDALAAEEIEEADHVIRVLKLQPTPLSQKVEIAKEEQAVMASAKQRLSPFQLWVTERKKDLSRLHRQMKTAIQDNRLWESSIKLLAGKHGAAVGMYFTFLRWCLLLNILIALLWIAFVIIPYAFVRGSFHAHSSIVPPYFEPSGADQTLAGLFTGGGALNYSAYFIGAYYVPYKTGTTTLTDYNYNIPLAYLLVGGLYLSVAFALIFKRVYRAVYNHASISHEGHHVFSELVFCSFDHSLMDPDAAGLKRIGLVQAVRETLAEFQSMEEYRKRSKRALYIRRLGISAFILAVLALALFAVKSAVDAYATSSGFLYFIPSIILAAFNLLLPEGFRLLAEYEQWRTELFVIQLTVVRAMILRIAGFFVFFYTLFLRRTQYMCWESFVGQYVYSLFIIVMIVDCATNVCKPSMQRFCYQRFKWMRKYIDPARFETIQCTIELIYTQAIVLFGTFFCPLLPVLGVLKSLIIFYLQRAVTLAFCDPPVRPFKARHSFSGLFYGVMLLMLFCVAFPLGYTIVSLPTSGAYMSSSDLSQFMSLSGTSSPTCSTTMTCADCLSASANLSSTVCWNPSGAAGLLVAASALCSSCPSGCGPFRNQKTIYDTVITEFHTWPSSAQNGLQFIGTTAFAGLVILILILLFFYEHARAAARGRLVERVRVERDMERMDKIWILQKYAITLDDLS